jgi:hypothetical protein
MLLKISIFSPNNNKTIMATVRLFYYGEEEWMRWLELVAYRAGFLGET